jgi:hypothetical protein
VNAEKLTCLSVRSRASIRRLLGSIICELFPPLRQAVREDPAGQPGPAPKPGPVDMCKRRPIPAQRTPKRGSQQGAVQPGRIPRQSVSEAVVTTIVKTYCDQRNLSSSSKKGTATLTHPRSRAAYPLFTEVISDIQQQYNYI